MRSTGGLIFGVMNIIGNFGSKWNSSCLGGGGGREKGFVPCLQRRVVITFLHILTSPTSKPSFVTRPTGRGLSLQLLRRPSRRTCLVASPGFRFPSVSPQREILRSYGKCPTDPAPSAQTWSRCCCPRCQALSFRDRRWAAGPRRGSCSNGQGRRRCHAPSSLLGRHFGDQCRASCCQLDLDFRYLQMLRSSHTTRSSRLIASLTDA